jgi:hypothetical protein
VNPVNPFDSYFVITLAALALWGGGAWCMWHGDVATAPVIRPLFSALIVSLLAATMPVASVHDGILFLVAFGTIPTMPVFYLLRWRIVRGDTACRWVFAGTVLAIGAVAAAVPDPTLTRVGGAAGALWVAGGVLVFPTAWLSWIRPASPSIVQSAKAVFDSIGFSAARGLGIAIATEAAAVGVADKAVRWRLALAVIIALAGGLVVYRMLRRLSSDDRLTLAALVGVGGAAAVVYTGGIVVELKATMAVGAPLSVAMVNFFSSHYLDPIGMAAAALGVTRLRPPQARPWAIGLVVIFATFAVPMTVARDAGLGAQLSYLVLVTELIMAVVSSRPARDRVRKSRVNKTTPASETSAQDTSVLHRLPLAEPPPPNMR